MDNVSLEVSNSISENFGDRIILNNYEDFIEKVVFSIRSI